MFSLLLNHEVAIVTATGTHRGLCVAVGEDSLELYQPLAANTRKVIPFEDIFATTRYSAV